MNPLKKDASTRTKEYIESIRHVYIDLDRGAAESLEAVEHFSVVPTPNYVLNSSPEKHQVVWKVEGMNLQEAEGLLCAMAYEFGGDPAATDATRVLRVPGFANKKYDTDFYCRSPQRIHGKVQSSGFQTALRLTVLPASELLQPHESRFPATEQFKSDRTRLGFRQTRPRPRR
jgi:hypothetical protein